ncbi:MAG: hypothetical protein UW55_C0033G0008 [Candidatus Giovannonibacteria bacterium GW2011_GWA2_44_26]|uniref:Endonuclease/exonuclease/phosphatase domain-containing protein n=1 Tax=Candidatus Giovannonibacteria bacterium GW2011_GWA2_44_26 TaxID=1618648 RepID=A0A0G1KYA6_9BACT|nr:MAG: hypothetical protein UW55_C0033G0008 [Candidatus Giovannonibacteria bacterium GW2011_GWA2_44_26]
MKLISLNTWCGRAGKNKLLEFFKKYEDVDIFCLQEISSVSYEYLNEHITDKTGTADEGTMIHGMQDISAVLANHVALFRPHYLDNYGLMLLVKKGLDILEEGDFFVYKEKGYTPNGDAGFHARNVQYVTIATKKSNYTVMNFHGLWNGGGKWDTNDRLTQSERIVDFMKSITSPYLICGDFNLLPTTESIRRFEDAGLRNLIREYGITSTRTSYYTKEHKFADYVLASAEIKVSTFEVLPDEVSDHSPIYIEFD